MFSCEASEIALLLHVFIDFAGPLVSYSAYLSVTLGTIEIDLVLGAIDTRREVDRQMAFCCVPRKIANELQSGITNKKCEGGAVFDELTSFGIVGILCVDHFDGLAADLTVDTSDGSLVVCSQIFWN